MVNYDELFKDEPKEIIEYNKNIIENKLYNQYYNWRYFYNDINGYYYYSRYEGFNLYLKTKEKLILIYNNFMLYNNEKNITYFGNDDYIYNISEIRYNINGKLFATKYFIYYVDNDTGLCYIDNIGPYQDFELFRDKRGNNIVIKEFINEFEYKGFKIMIIKDIKNDYYMTETYSPSSGYKIDNVPSDAKQAYNILIEIRNQE